MDTFVQTFVIQNIIAIRSAVSSVALIVTKFNPVNTVDGVVVETSDVVVVNFVAIVSRNQVLAVVVVPVAATVVVVAGTCVRGAAWAARRQASLMYGVAVAWAAWQMG